jgi:hypothetical protein
VDSSYSDLVEHRARVIEQLRRSGFDVVAMEDWTAGPDAPTRLYPDRVRSWDLVLLLVGFCRGHVGNSCHGVAVNAVLRSPGETV